MQELEFAKGSSYGLTLSLVAETVVELGMELREAKGALSRWQKSRRAKCATVQFQIVSPVKEHAEVERVLERLYQDRLEPGPFLRGLTVEVALLNDKGKRVKGFVLGDASSAITAAPPPGAKPGSKPAAPAGAKTPAKADPKDDDEDGEPGSAYAMVDAPAPAAEEEKAKPKEKPKAVRRELKKKQVQFAVEWQAVRQPLMIFAIGLCVEVLVWLLQLVILILGMTAHVSYAEAREEALFQSPKDPEEYKEGDYEPMYRVSFAVSLVVGTGWRTLGQMLYIVVEVLRLVEGGLWLTAYFLCLRCPNVRGTRGQALALIALGMVNMLVTILLKLLPLTGAVTFAQLPLVVPELPLSEANIDRTLPLNAFWSWLPFPAYFFSILLTLSYHAEIILFAVYVWTMSEAIRDEVLPGKIQPLVQLGLGQAFGLLAYHLISITGTSEVQRMVLWAFIFLWRAFYLWFLVWFVFLLMEARVRVEKIVTDEDIRRAEEEEDQEDYEEDDEDDDEDY